MVYQIIPLLKMEAELLSYLNKHLLGGTTISDGTLEVASDANLGSTPGSADVDNIIFNGGTLNTSSGFTLNSNRGITMTGAGTINTNAGTTLTYGGLITGSGALTKSGQRNAYPDWNKHLLGKYHYF